MCGICGILLRDRAKVETQVLQKMNTAITHRGPDGEGYYQRPGIGLAMRRLAIIDLVSGDQPITNEDETVWVIFNGEIYNFPALRADLEKRGHTFRTHSDTECIVHLYEEYRDDCVKHLSGMFAFALWDEKNQRLLLARDRLGKKPIYYTEQAGGLFFSSELPSLLLALQGYGIPARISRRVMDAYLSLQYIPEPYTPFEHVFKLPAAHRMIYDGFDFRLERYWDLEYLPKWRGNEDELAEELRGRVRAAVEMRLISDVPLGAHLSGGIDSSIVVACMAQASTQPVKTFSVGFQEQAFSEVAYAREVAQRYSTDHHEFTLTHEHLPETMQTLVAHLGEPLADPSIIPLYHLARLTRQSVTVALNGDGGDEAFGGYSRYWLDPIANQYLRLPSWITRGVVPGLASLLPERADRPAGDSLVNGLKRLEQLPGIDRRASILRWGSYFSPAAKNSLWRENLPSTTLILDAEAYLVQHFDEAHADSYLDRTLYTDITTYLPGALLVKADRMTMANSLEARSPFLDHELMEWAARLPESMKVRQFRGKYLLRKAFHEALPESIQRRGKQGFGIPVGMWLREGLGDWSRQVLLDRRMTATWFNRHTIETLLDEHGQGRVDHGKRLWALLMLGLWLEKFA